LKDKIKMPQAHRHVLYNKKTMPLHSIEKKALGIKGRIVG
jgi:hypothetical protein